MRIQAQNICIHTKIQHTYNTYVYIHKDTTHIQHKCIYTKIQTYTKIQHIYIRTQRYNIHRYTYNTDTHNTYDTYNTYNIYEHINKSTYLPAPKVTVCLIAHVDPCLHRRGGGREREERKREGGREGGRE